MDLLAQLATLVRVVESGSLSAAARSLRRSPAAVSRQLAALERQLGAPLVLRTTRSLQVTDAGRACYRQAQRVLHEVEVTQGLVGGARAVRGRLVVSAPVTFGLARVAPALPGLLRRHPGLELDLRLEDRPVDLVAEGVDLAIRIGAPPPDTASVIARGLGAYGRLPVAAPAYLRQCPPPAEPADLAQHDALLQLPAGAPPAPWRFSRGGREVVVEPRGRLRTNVVQALRDGALAGLGVALLPEWLVADDLAAGRLEALLPGWSAARVEVLALHRAELRGAPRLKVFLEHLGEQLAR